MRVSVSGHSTAPVTDVPPNPRVSMLTCAHIIFSITSEWNDDDVVLDGGSNNDFALCVVLGPHHHVWDPFVRALAQLDNLLTRVTCKHID